MRRDSKSSIFLVSVQIHDHGQINIILKKQSDWNYTSIERLELRSFRKLMYNTGMEIMYEKNKNMQLFKNLRCILYWQCIKSIQPPDIKKSCIQILLDLISNPKRQNSLLEKSKHPVQVTCETVAQVPHE